jgi:hypothetical protein
VTRGVLADETLQRLIPACGMNHPRFKFIFLDKWAPDMSMTPSYGRAPRGERVVDYAPRNYGE